MFNSLLVANRGEIAVRVLRTARRMGLRTIAVYSDADRDALHVQMADEALRLGPAPARESYLRADLILEAARRSGATAIHPGYGFLSENAGFAQACSDAGVSFVGPPAAAIRAMGSKSESKRIMAAAGVPLVPGYHDAGQSDAQLVAAAARIGWPVLVKASAGGGGKGMRIVRAAAELGAALAGARREARAAFGDDTLLLEKYLERPRHVEVQVFADTHGGCVPLFDRDCSLQRRHQKVIEEAPAPGLSDALRTRMAAAAIAAARAVGYVGAGTIEFLVQGDAFYFIEMNTRLQVEHPVTEMITGLDLVEWQLRVAAGEPLPVSQIPPRPRGHALEARLYAEDPGRDFLPATGRLSYLRFPGASNECRIDTGVREGDLISEHYDPLIAKLIVHGSDRAQALRNLQLALRGCEIAGLATNTSLLTEIAAHSQFAAGQIDTGFIARHAAELLPVEAPHAADALLLAALVAHATECTERADAARRSGDPWSPWNAMDAWQSNLDSQHLVHLRDEHAVNSVALRPRGRDGFELRLADGTVRIAAGLRWQDRILNVTLDGVHFRSVGVVNDPVIELLFAGRRWRWSCDELAAQRDADDAASGVICAPMPGAVVEVFVAEGQAVKRGEPLLIVEAMKMEHTLRAPRDGAVQGLHCVKGGRVTEGDELLRIV